HIKSTATVNCQRYTVNYQLSTLTFVRASLSTVNIAFLKLIPHPFHRPDKILFEFLPDLPNVHIHRSVTYNYLIPPNLVQNFIPEKYSSRFLGEQVKEFEFFLRESYLSSFNRHNKSFRIEIGRAHV